MPEKKIGFNHYTKTLLLNTPTPILEIPLSPSDFRSGSVVFRVVVSDGTYWEAGCGEFLFGVFAISPSVIISRIKTQYQDTDADTIHPQTFSYGWSLSQLPPVTLSLTLNSQLTPLPDFPRLDMVVYPVDGKDDFIYL